MLGRIIDREATSSYFDDEDPISIKCCILPCLVAQAVQNDVEDMEVIPILQESFSFSHSLSVDSMPSFDFGGNAAVPTSDPMLNNKQ